MSFPKSQPLRAVTYLAPSLPLELFEIVTETIAEAIDREVQLVPRERHVGLMGTDRDPFAADEVDLAFLCSSSYLSLRSQQKPSVELVPAGLLFRDERTGGKPVYFSEILVRKSHPAENFDDLEGCIWGYNDTSSLSGYLSTCQKLKELSRTDGYFEREVDTGSHLRSVQAILQRDIDAAAIDSNVLTRLFTEHPALMEDLRVLDSWGPYPIQPIVLRASLSHYLQPIASALLGIDRDAERKQRLSDLGVRGFREVTVEDYEAERTEMRALGLIA